MLEKQKRQKKERETREEKKEEKQKQKIKIKTKSILNLSCQKLCKSGARGGCWPWLGEALGGCSPPLGGSMGCMQPHTSGGWVSPGYPPPIMLLDTDISGAHAIVIMTCCLNPCNIRTQSEGES
jgi:hypothetical protein